MYELNQMNLEAEMAKITREEGKIPSTLYIEMSLAHKAGLITRYIARATSNNGVEYFSQVYPGLTVVVWDISGWELK